ncbi:MAG: thiaminase II, partial [Alicyclobacillus sp.]|nr:thiaminase II [Alicyclobacillus sp.]
MTKFTDTLRSTADPLFQAVRNHPFVVGIATENLRPEQLVHYVRQDFQYLSTYARVYALALAKCASRDDMRMFHERIGFILNEEIHPHLNLCRVAGVP